MSRAREVLTDLVGCFPRFRRHNGMHLCAGVSFYALLSLAPLLYLTGALLGRVLRNDDAMNRALAALEPLFPGSAGESLDLVAQSLRTDDPLVLLALPALVWVSSTVFAALHLAIHIAFERERRSTMLRGRLVSFAILGAGLLTLLATLVAATGLPRLEQLLAEAGMLPAGVPLTGPLSRLLIVSAPFVLFAVFYRFLPSGRVAWSSAGWGALLALALWESARRLFGRILSHSPALGLLSGTLSGIVTVLLWVYGAIAIFLIGAEFAALRQRRLESERGARKKARIHTPHAT